jgi:Flp pilus assembly pilin Flp
MSPRGNIRELSFDAEGRRTGYKAITKLKGANTMIKNFFRDETGLELSEYAVAAALVAMAVVVAFSALGTAIDGKITDLGTTITDGAPPAP